MTPEEKTKYQYRFKGYNLNMIQLDSTGPQFAIAGVHPYYDAQPAYWAHDSFFVRTVPQQSSRPSTSGKQLYPFAE